jgi:hypothetical protein
METLGNPLAFFDEIGNALSQVTGGGDESASAVNLSSSNIVTVILSVLSPPGQRNSDLSRLAGLQPDLPSRY